MRDYFYRALIEVEDAGQIVYPTHGANKQEALKNIDLLAKWKPIKVTRINKTDRKRKNQYNDFPSIDMAQASKE